MNDIKNVCVYSASSTKIDQSYFDAAEKLGKILAERKINLINGAGCLGLMCAYIFRSIPVHFPVAYKA